MGGPPGIDLSSERSSAHVDGSDLWCTVAGLKMYARVAGWTRDADVVVLVHGLGVSNRYMRPLLHALAPYVRAAAVDLPGFGRSAKPPSPLDVPALADALEGWMDAARIRSATLVGNSMGCQVIVDLAARRPVRVHRAVLVGPTLEPAMRNAARALWRLAIDATREAPSLPFIAAFDYLVAGPRVVWRTFRHAAVDRVETKLAAVRAPVLVVRGERDPIVSQEWVDTLAGLLPHGRVHVVRGAAHAVNYTAPEALAQAVLRFMNDR